MEQDAGEGRVGHGLAGGLPIFYGKVNGGRVQFEALGALGFHGIVTAILQGEVSPAVPPGGHGVHQGVVRSPADFKSGVGDALCFVRLGDLYELHAAHGVVVKTKGLRVVGVDGDGLALAVRVDGIALHTLQFSHYHCAGDPGQDDFSRGVGVVKAVAGQGAASGVHILAVGVFDLELDALQGDRLGAVPSPLLNHQIPQGLIAELHSDGLALLDLDRLRRIVQQVAGLCPGFLND